MSKDFWPYLIPLLVAVLVFRRAGRPQNINPGRMWVRSALFAVLTLLALGEGPMPSPLIIVAFVVIACGGVGLGYFRASHQTLSIDPKTGRVLSQTTAVGTYILLGLFVVRFGIRLAFPQAPGRTDATVTDLANALLIFTVAMLITQTFLIAARTRPLLQAHRDGTLNRAPD